MVKFRYESTSAQFVDRSNSLTYAFGKVNGTILTDVDKNGYIDIVTFPSNLEHDRYLAPIVWLNNHGKFVPSSTAISGNLSYQYLRDSVQGDFNKDGLMDFMLIDQGWELQGRNPEYFFGSTNHLLKGTANGLASQSTSSWKLSDPQEKSFNHIADTADFDQDGDLDVVVATMSDIRVYQNTGTGQFSVMENAFPTFYTSGSGFRSSGTTFIKLGNEYAVVAGAYRAWEKDPWEGYLDPVVFQYKDKRFIESYNLDRPDLGGREVNFGAVDMYNIDINNDGREDLVITWETEARGGYNDGLSNLQGGPKDTRYKDLSNTLVTIWFQDSQGKLIKDPSNKVYNMHAWNAGSELRFEDLNKDGYIDFWTTSYGIHPNDFENLLWFNDGKGNFYQIDNLITVDKHFESWDIMAPWFFDANNDGNIDIIATKAVFDNDWNVRNVGEEVYVFLNTLAPDNKKSTAAPITITGKTIQGTTKKDILTGTDGADIIRGDLGIDKVYGKMGADQFVFDTPTYTIGKFNQVKSNKNQDTIYDFDSREDQLVFDTKVFSLFADDTDWTDNVAGSFIEQDTDDWLVYDSGYIYYDINGSLPGGRSLVAQLVGSPELTFDNVMFI